MPSPPVVPPAPHREPSPDPRFVVSDAFYPPVVFTDSTLADAYRSATAPLSELWAEIVPTPADDEGFDQGIVNLPQSPDVIRRLHEELGEAVRKLARYGNFFEGRAGELAREAIGSREAFVRPMPHLVNQFARYSALAQVFDLLRRTDVDGNTWSREEIVPQLYHGDHSVANTFRASPPLSKLQDLAFTKINERSCILLSVALLDSALGHRPDELAVPPGVRHIREFLYDLADSVDSVDNSRLESQWETIETLWRTIAEPEAWGADATINEESVEYINLMSEACEVLTSTRPAVRRLTDSFGMFQAAIAATGVIEYDFAPGFSREADQLIFAVAGNPFDTPPLAGIKYGADTKALAAAMYTDNDFRRLPELRPLLERDGCTNVEILDLCEAKESGVRGFFVIDHILLA